MQSLEDLVLQAQLGDKHAYTAIYTRFRDMALSYAFSIVGDYDLAEDARQEAFTSAYCDLVSLRNPKAFPGWFRTIVFNSSVTMARRRGRPPVDIDEARHLASNDPSAAETMGRVDEQKNVEAAINRLPSKEAAAVRLFYLESKTLKEVSRALGLPVNTVKGKLHTARARLKQMLNGRPKSKSAPGPANAPAKAKKEILKAASKEAIGQFENELQTMLSFSEPEGQKKITDMVCAQARLHRFLGQNEAALAALRRGLALPFVAANPAFRSRLRAEMGLTYVQTADYPRAKREFRYSHGLDPNERQNKAILSAVFNGMGMCAWGGGAFRKAREFYTESLRIGKGHASEIQRAETSNNLALLDWKEGHLSDAARNFEASLARWKKAKCPFGAALTQMNLGIVEENLGHFTKADRYYRAALNAARQHEFVQLETAAESNVASLALQHQDWKQALTHSQSSLELARKTSDRRSEAIALENLALAQLGLGNPAQCAAEIARGRTLAKRIGDKERLFSLELVEIEMLLAGERLDGLDKRFTGLHKKLKSFGYHSELPRLLGLRGSYEYFAGSIQRAFKTFEEAIETSRKQGNKAAEHRIRQAMDVCKQRPSPAQKQ